MSINLLELDLVNQEDKINIVKIKAELQETYTHF